MNNPVFAKLAQGISSTDNSVVLPIVIGIFFVLLIVFVIYAIIKF